MPRTSVGQTRARTTVRLTEFKQNARRLLPPGHPVLTILKTVPDDLSIDDVRVLAPSIIALLEAA